MFQRFPVARICCVDIDLGEFAQVRQRDCRSCINKPASRGNHEHATRPIPDPGGRIRVSDFAAEVEAAQESEHLGDRRALFAAEFSGDACPDFLCIGAQKAGTTWLYQQLESHPDFWMPPFKELHYLNDLGRVERAATPRRRDERDVLFLERLQKLTAEPSLSLRNYA